MKTEIGVMKAKNCQQPPETVRIIASVTPLRGMYTREMKIYIHTNDSYRNVHSSVICKCQKVFTVHIFIN